MDIGINDTKKNELPKISGAVMICRKIIDRVVPDIQNKNLAIYPCGKRCDYVVDYLKKEYDLSVDLMVDNYKANCIRTYELKHIDYYDYVFLIASDSSEYYKKIRKEIRRYVSCRAHEKSGKIKRVSKKNALSLRERGIITHC